MSMIGEKFVGRDFKKNPLTRKCTQVHCCASDDDAAVTQQGHNDGNRLDSAKIVQRAYETGVHFARDGASRFIDASHITDFREAMTIKARADQAFENLPPALTELFDNQQAFVEFVTNEANIDTLREWGLVAPLKVAGAARETAPAVAEADPKPPVVDAQAKA